MAQPVPVPNDFQQETELQQSELVLPDSNARGFTPSEDYVIIDDEEQEKPVEKPVEQGRSFVGCVHVFCFASLTKQMFCRFSRVEEKTADEISADHAYCVFA